MPVLTFKSCELPPAQDAMGELAKRVAKLLGQPEDRVWLLWERLSENEYWQPQWSGRKDMAAPIIEIWHRAAYSDLRMAELIRRLPDWCAELLKCKGEEVFVRTLPVHAMEGFARGDFLDANDAKTDKISMTPIGVVQNTSENLVDEGWGKVQSTITLNEAIYRREALKGLNDFSHIEIVFFLHKASAFPESLGERFPRGRKDLPSVGILAQRCKDRVNRIGVSCCKVVAVHQNTIVVEGLDAVNGTPVLDLKPVIQEFLPSSPSTQPDWVRDIMKGYF